MRFRDFFKEGGFILVSKELARAIGIDSTVLFGELLSKYDYYEKEGKLTDDGFFFHTQEMIEESTTLTRRKQEKALKVLEEVGLLESDLRGMPATKHFKLFDSDEEIKAAVARALGDKQVCTKRTNKNVQNVQTELYRTYKQDCTERTLNNNNNNKKNNKNTVSKLTAEQSSEKAQATLFNLPQKEKAVKAKTNPQKAVEKVERAVSGEVGWTEIKPSHLAYYYQSKHLEIVGQPIRYQQQADIGAFKDGFLSKYKLMGNPETAVQAIDTLLQIFKEKKKVDNGGYDILSFNALSGNYAFMNNHMETVFKRLKRQTVKSEAVIEHEPITDDDIF